MSAFSISMMVELVVGVLLVATIAYCFVLDRRLKALRDGEGELRKIIVALDKATTRAQGAVTDLRVSCDGLTRDMDRDLKKARALADELAVMVEAGDHIAERLGSASNAGARKAASDLSGEDGPRADETTRDAGDEDDPLAETGLAAALRQMR
ncbi:DUF6468 domain-containing protein [Pyruvatibacter mobilis]|uniref:DUF6468 domain-containing protein n=1 Tax=Pyruvatibacter mobilis TaxID=1712261 RepID=UPI003BAE283B